MSGSGPRGAPELRDRRSDWLRTGAQTLVLRMNRRGFLGTMSKGAVLVVAAVSGIAPFGSNVRTALAGCTSPACCYGCIGDCTCGPYWSLCDHTYTFYLPNSSGQLGQSYASCRVNCGNSPFQCCFAYVPNQDYGYGCPCQALDCTGGCGTGGPC